MIETPTEKLMRLISHVRDQLHRRVPMLRSVAARLRTEGLDHEAASLEELATVLDHIRAALTRNADLTMTDTQPIDVGAINRARR